MYAFVYEVFYDAISILLQLLAGCSLLFFLYWFCVNRKIKRCVDCTNNIAFIFVSAVAGFILPFEAYGTVAVVFGLYVAGVRITALIPLLVSNFIFNISIPFSEAGFVWKANVFRIFAAFAVGTISGLILSFFNVKESQLIRERHIGSLILKQNDLRSLIGLCRIFIDSMGLYIIFGAVLNTIFSRYVFYSLLKLIYSSWAGSAALNFFMGFDITNFMFAAAGQIINRLMDFISLSAFIWLFKFKSLVILYIYYFIIVIVLIIPLFL